MAYPSGGASVGSSAPHKIRPQPIQSTVFISHLTNSNGCGNLQAKVLLTVSPFLPSFLPQSGVFPRVSSLSALESALTKNWPVTPLDSALTKTPGVGACFRSSPKPRVLSSLLPLSFSLLAFSSLASFIFNRLQPLFPKHRGVGVDYV